MHTWHTDQITDCLNGRECACFQQQQECRFDVCFRDRRSQMQHANVLLLRTFGTLCQQSIIRCRKGVVGNNLLMKDGGDAHEVRLEELRGVRGDPPPHFVQRSDAQERVPLRVPVLDGPFFDALLARRTTRAYRSEEPLSASALELMLYAVFGTHGIKFFAKDIAAIKRTSPSGGALHPIEAYVLVINVQDMPAGLYHYETGAHVLAELERMDRVNARNLACEFTAGQTYFAEAHALVIHVARFDRNFVRHARPPTGAPEASTRAARYQGRLLAAAPPPP